MYTLSLDPNFSAFLVGGVTWGKKTKSAPLREFTDDDADVALVSRSTAAQKSEHFKDNVRTNCELLSRTLTKYHRPEFHVVKSVWQNNRLHYGFHATGGHFVDFVSICIDPDEKPKDWYQHLVAFVRDKLLTVDGNISHSHHGEKSTEDENLSATFEMLCVLT